MQENTIDLILQSKLSQRAVTLTHPQTITVREAIAEYAIYAVERYRSNEGRGVMMEAIKIFPSLLKADFMLALRKFFYNRAKSMAIARSKMENWKVYVIRTSDIAYAVLSTKDVDLNKKMRIFGKQVDAMMLTQMSDFVAYPIR